MGASDRDHRCQAGHQSLCDSGHIDGTCLGLFTARTAPAALIYMRASWTLPARSAKEFPITKIAAGRVLSPVMASNGAVQMAAQRLKQPGFFELDFYSGSGPKQLEPARGIGTTAENLGTRRSPCRPVRQLAVALMSTTMATTTFM